MYRKIKTTVTHTLCNLLAAALAVSLVSGGTMAWQSFDQVAINETSSDFLVGGRLHTDFNGVSKNIYVENFTSVEEGAAIFARVRLEEYMEIGEDAGIKDPELMNPDIYKKGGMTTDINDVDTWDIIYLQDNGILNGNSAIRNYISLQGGGQGVYMPTFNKNMDSRRGDINGTLAGPDTYERETEDAHQDFILYNLDGSNGGLTQRTDIATYDYDDDDIEEEDPIITTDDNMLQEADIYQVEETHYAKLTDKGTIITMKDWMAMGSPIGAYWVFDTDGWAYWAQPIQPDTATGLILDEITVHTFLENSWYYEINARGQYATRGDWGREENADELATGFYVDGITSNGLQLLNCIAGIQ